MPRDRRGDADGRYFHVMNRGIARRTVFENRSDARFFLSRLAKAVRRGEVEVLAYALLTNHYHVLVRSRGGLSEAFRRLQMDFVRRFNRSRGRDGPLFRSRFRSKPVPTRAYLRNVYFYVLENPIESGLASTSDEYPWCSAHSISNGRVPRWIALDRIEHLGLARRGCPTSRFAPQVRRDRAALVERRLGTTNDSAVDPMDDLLANDVRGSCWMRITTRLADGTLPGQPVAGIETVLRYIKEEVPAALTIATPGARERPASLPMMAGLLSNLSAASLVEVGKTIGRSRSNAGELIEIHKSALRTDPAYRRIVLAVVHDCLLSLR